MKRNSQRLTSPVYPEKLSWLERWLPAWVRAIIWSVLGALSALAIIGLMILPFVCLAGAFSLNGLLAAIMPSSASAVTGPTGESLLPPDTNAPTATTASSSPAKSIAEPPTATLELPTSSSEPSTTPPEPPQTTPASSTVTPLSPTDTPFPPEPHTPLPPIDTAEPLTISLNSPTVTSTPTSTPTPLPTATSTPVRRVSTTINPPTSGLNLPRGVLTLLNPLSLDVPTYGPTTFEWEWIGDSLAPTFGFEVSVWLPNEARASVHDAVRDNQKGGAIEKVDTNRYRLKVSNLRYAKGVLGRPGIYLWTVGIVRVNPNYVDYGLQANSTRLRYENIRR